MGPKAKTIKFYSTISDRSEVIHLISRLFSGDGGPGSGNFNHSGRPGKVGGSAPEGTASSNKASVQKKVPETESEFERAVSEKQKERREAQERVYDLSDKMNEAMVQMMMAKRESNDPEEIQEKIDAYFKAGFEHGEAVNKLNALRKEERGLEAKRENLERQRVREEERAKSEKIEAKEPETPEEYDDLIALKEQDVNDVRFEIRVYSEEAEDLKQKIIKLRNDGEDDLADQVEDEYYAKRAECDGAEFELRMLKSEVEEMRKKQRELIRRKDQEAVEESGKTEAQYRRDKAVGEFGYTDDYHEAGWILPNGGMLNFGDPDESTGEREYDHREIARCYGGATGGGSEEMRRFRNDGNVRMYPEIPGINVAVTGHDLTPEQYDTLRQIIDEVNEERRGQFCIDFSTSDGDMYGQLSYTTDPDYGDDHTQYTGDYIDFDEVAKDLRAHLETGEITEEFGRATFSQDANAVDGGPGSGNFGHAGRPGKVGGSSENGGSSGNNEEEIESLKKQISGMSRFGEQGKKRAELSKRLKELSGEKSSKASNKPKSRESELFETLEIAREARNKISKQIEEMEPQKNGWVEKIIEANEAGNLKDVMAEYKKWESQYKKLTEAYSEAADEVERAKKAYESFQDSDAQAKEDEEIRKSGLSEADWRRKKAVEHYGYTKDFKEAGYMLPDGKMLNFCGSKGQHYGIRGNDHRDIAELYAVHNYTGSDAMVRFMSDGNIRIYGEQGVDVCSELEPTNDQYSQIERMASRASKEGSFSVDLTDKAGKTVGSLYYEGKIEPSKVVRDIKKFYSTGDLPKEGGLSSFYGDDKAKVATDGGPGSGNFGHAGRPGKVGGSGPGGGSAFRSGSKETGYSSFTGNKFFKGIASHARNAKTKAEFIHSMNNDQRDAIRNQWKACGAKEGLGEYAERMYDMLHGRKGSEIRQTNKPVEGKDLSDTWEYDESGARKSWEASSTPEIDTEIEAILHAQGYDGIPKIVSKAEFDRITESHPEMPILMRSYAAPTQEQLDQYDEDLEKGFFYVDCSTGGAGFGQGMYCAGVYQMGNKPVDLSEVSKIEDIKKVKFIRTEDGKIYNKLGYATRQGGTSGILHYNLNEGDRCLLWFGDKRTGMYEVKTNEDGKLYLQDPQTGDTMTIGDADEADGILQCHEVDVQRRKDLLMKGAIEEMKHYQKLNIRRIVDSDPHVAPEGKVMVTGGTNDQPLYKYYDPSSFTDFSEPPEDGQMIVYWDGESKEPSGEIYTYRDGKIEGSFAKWDVGKGDRWAVLEGDCEKVEIDPKATARLMTLDPSAKIIDLPDLLELKSKLADKRQEERSKFLAEKKKEFVDSLADDILKSNGITGEKADKYREMFHLYEFGWSREDSEREEALERELGENNGRGLLSIFARKLNDYEPPRPKYKPIPSDYGVLAAMFGYDAINAVGHGQSKSYTVVLNRTKIILCEEKVDVAG